MPTTCKTWSCKGCRDRVASLVKLRIVHGVSVLGQCWFITVTFKQVLGKPNRDAASVRKVWAAFHRYLKRDHPEWSQMSWFKIIEKTKKGQPHLHLVVGGLGSATSSSIERAWRKAWWRASGDSFIVHVREVDSGPRAAFYMAKYLTKALNSWAHLLSLGFKRKWSRSRNWPGGTIRLYGTEMELWTRIDWTPSGPNTDRMAKALAEARKGHPLIDRTGDDMAMDVAHKATRRRLKAVLKGLAAQMVREVK